MSDRGWSDAVRARPRRPRGACLDEASALAFHAGELPAARQDAAREHLAECPSCLELTRDARRFLAAMEETAPAAAAARPWRAGLLATAAAALLALAVWWRPAAPPVSDVLPSAGPTAVPPSPPALSALATLVVEKAPYVPAVASPDEVTWRDSGDPAGAATAKAAFAKAMIPYERGRFAGAEAALAQLLAQHPRHADAHFYRGVCLLLLGRPAEAVAPLEHARDLARGPRRQDALWYLALAHVKAGAPSEALAPLAALSGASNPRRLEAERLRDEIRAVAAPSPAR